MKKNKTIAYMLAAGLLVGGTFVGTKALFTDNINTVGELKISTGDVDIEVLGTSKWELLRNGSELKEGTNIKDQLGKDGFAPESDNNKQDVVPTDNNGKETPFANNLKPGDKLRKIVEVKNVGTLDAKLSLDSTGVSEKLGELKDFITVEESSIVDASGNGILEPGEIATFTLTLNANQESVHNTSSTGSVKDNNDKQEDAIVDLTNAWVLTAVSYTHLTLPTT